MIMHILCMTDIHGDGKSVASLLEKERDADLLIVAGDITHLGESGDAAKILSPLLKEVVPLFVVTGNMDYPDVLDLLREKEVNLHGEYRKFAGVGFAGLGGSNPTPFGTPQEYNDDEAKAILSGPLRLLGGTPVRVLVSHAPPVNTTLDRVKMGIHAGSSIVREILVKHQIDLCICGHIHEAGGVEKVEGCVCVNPGPLSGGNYAYVTIESDLSGNPDTTTIDVERRKL